MTEEIVFLVYEFRHGHDDFVIVGFYSNQADARVRMAQCKSGTAAIKPHYMSDALDSLVKDKLARLGLQIVPLVEDDAS